MVWEPEDADHRETFDARLPAGPAQVHMEDTGDALEDREEEDGEQRPCEPCGREGDPGDQEDMEDGGSLADMDWEEDRPEDS